MSAHRTALGVVAALHRGDRDGAVVLIEELSRDEMLAVIVHLTHRLIAAWGAACEHGGQDLTEIIQHVSLMLAAVDES